MVSGIVCTISLGVCRLYVLLMGVSLCRFIVCGMSLNMNNYGLCELGIVCINV